MRGKKVGSQQNTLQPLRRVRVCAQGYTGLIRNSSAAFSVPVNHPCPHFLFFSVHLFCCFLPIHCTFCFAAVCLCSEYFWVTHLSQVTDNMSWTHLGHCLLTCWSITSHGCHDVRVSFRDQGQSHILPWSYYYSSHQVVREHTLDNLLYISCLLSVLIMAIICNQHCCCMLLMMNCLPVWIACRAQTTRIWEEKFNSSERWQNTWLAH